MTLALLTLLVACSPETPPRELTLAAYTTPREAYAELLPRFAAIWREKTGETLTFQESYQGSGAQSRAVVEGLEADVVALSLEPDLTRIAKAGLITSDWKAVGDGGMVSTSLVVIAVRPGNPKGIHDWADLARPGLEVLTPNVRTSGGAMWNVAAIWGAATRGHAGAPAGDTDAATALLSGVLANVRVMDKGARESMLTFESGQGDAAITYENEVLAARLEGKEMDYVVPKSTILIENPVAVVDSYADAQGDGALALDFVAFLHTPEAQRAYARHGLRPVDASVLPPGLPSPADTFTIRDLGDWEAVDRDLFAAGAAYDRALGSSPSAP